MAEDSKNVQEEQVITLEQVESFLKTSEGKKFIQPKYDTFFSNGLKTWKEKTLPTLIDEEIAKRNPEETPEQKRIRELEEKLNAQERNATVSQLKASTLQTLSEKELPSELVDLLPFESEEVTRNSVDKFEKMFKKYVDTTVEKRLKSQGKTPQAKQENGFESTDMTKDKLLSMSVAESTAFYNENPELFRKIMNG